MGYSDIYSDTYEADQRPPRLPVTETVVWNLDDKEVLVADDWVGTADDRGGFAEAQIRALDLGRFARSVDRGMPLIAYEQGSGEIVWTGTVDGEPRTEGQALEVRGVGPQAVLEAKQTFRNYLIRGLFIWRDAHDPPHSFVSSNDTDEILADLKGAGMIFGVEKGETQATDARHLLAAWTPGSNVTSLAFDYRKIWNNGNHRLRTQPFTGSQGALGTATDISMATGSANTWISVDQSIGTPENAVAFGFVVATGDTWAQKQIVRVNNLRVRGIATGDTMDASAVVADIGTAAGFSTPRVMDFLNDIMPFYIQDSWADALDYIATMTDRWWGIYDGGLEYDTYDSTMWETSEEFGASVSHCHPLRPASSVLVSYPDLNGDELFHEVVVSPNPNEDIDETPQAELEIRDPQHNDALAEEVANWNLDYLTSSGWEIEALVTHASRDGVPVSPYRIRPGAMIHLRDCVSTGHAEERIRATRYTQFGTEVGANVNVSVAEELEDLLDIKRRTRIKRPRHPRRKRKPRFPRR